MHSATRDDGSRGRGHDILATGPLKGLDRRNLDGNCLLERVSTRILTPIEADKIRRLAALPEGVREASPKLILYGVLGPRANREARGTHTHEDPFWIFGLPTYSMY